MRIVFGNLFLLRFFDDFQVTVPNQIRKFLWSFDWISRPRIYSVDCLAEICLVKFENRRSHFQSNLFQEHRWQ